MRDKNHGFTLIELLIVVAIIGILAAIAVPNFMNARIRSKVARAYADMKSVEYPIMQYKMDHGIFPVTQFIPGRFTTRYPIALTTPYAYIQSVPKDIFGNYELEQGLFPNLHFTLLPPHTEDMSYSYTRYGPDIEYPEHDPSNIVIIDNKILMLMSVRPPTFYFWYPKEKIHWRLESAGPDQIRWRSRIFMDIPYTEPLYDASNGIVSNGNLYLSDEGMGARLMKYKSMMEQEGE